MKQRTFKARWTNPNKDGPELASRYNAVVEDMTKSGTPTVCYLSPVARAERIANALTLLDRFSDSELTNMVKALLESFG